MLNRLLNQTLRTSDHPGDWLFCLFAASDHPLGPFHPEPDAPRCLTRSSPHHRWSARPQPMVRAPRKWRHASRARSNRASWSAGVENGALVFQGRTLNGAVSLIRNAVSNRARQSLAERLGQSLGTFQPTPQPRNLSLLSPLGRILQYASPVSGTATTTPMELHPPGSQDLSQQFCPFRGGPGQLFYGGG